MRWPAAWGWPGALAVLILMAAGVLANVWTPRWQTDAAQLRQVRLAAARPAAIVPVVPTPLRLPDVGEVDDRVAALLALAPVHGVVIEAADQRVDAATPVPRLQLTLATRGRYGELRTFVEAALLQDAGLTLDQLRLQRPAATTDVLRAHLRWVLLLPTAGPRP